MIHLFFLKIIKLFTESVIAWGTNLWLGVSIRILGDGFPNPTHSRLKESPIDTVETRGFGL